MATELAVTIAASLLQHRARTLVHTDRNAQILSGFVDGEVVGAGKSPAAELVWGARRSPPARASPGRSAVLRPPRAGSCKGSSMTPRSRELSWLQYSESHVL